MTEHSPFSTGDPSRDPTAPSPRTSATRERSPDRLPDPETVVPTGETPAARCPYCERPFTSERLRALHVGEAHACTAEEWTAYEAAREAEGDDLFVYHLKIVAALSLLYAGSVIGYMVVLGS